MAILLIDDSRDNCLLIGSYLKSAGYAVVTTNSSEEALHYLKGETESKPLALIDLILLDVNMPGFDELDACSRIKAMTQFEAVPILMVSGDTTSGTIQLALRRGAVDYVRKPIIKAELLAKVAMALRIQEDASLLAQAQQIVAQKTNVQVPLSIDVVTGIMNWWRFDELFGQEWEHAARVHLPLSLLFFTLESFKAFIDTNGCVADDECLQKIAQAEQANFSQPGQVVARYRGAEFAVLLIGTGAEGTKPMVDHLHTTIEALNLGPTVAVVVATAYPHEGPSPAALLTSAKNAIPNRQ